MDETKKCSLFKVITLPTMMIFISAYKSIVNEVECDFKDRKS